MPDQPTTIAHPDRTSNSAVSAAPTERLFVTLYCEQEARVEVVAPVGTPEGKSPSEGLWALALEALDRSGGAEWETTAAWVSKVEEPTDAK